MDRNGIVWSPQGSVAATYRAYLGDIQLLLTLGQTR